MIPSLASPPIFWPVVRLIVLAQLVLAGVLAPLYGVSGLVVDGWSFVPPVLLTAQLFALAAFLGVQDRSFALVLSIALLLSGSLIASPAQYLAVRLQQPLIDPWLARMDAALGFNVGEFAAWTAARPWLASVLASAYFTLIPQLVLTPVLLVADRAYDRMWRFLLHFHVCAAGTVAALALFPAACAFQYYGFTSTLPQERFITQFNGLRDGTFTTVSYSSLEGLISVPSFHMAGALMVVWAFRGWRLFPIVLILNTALVAATVLSGAHYIIDLPLTVVLFIGAVVFERWYISTTATNPQPSPAPQV